jgi:predicted NBD/HSP70 family sugar kinase
MESQASLRILGALWRSPGLSRRTLKPATGLHPNTVARVVSALIRDGYLREGPAAPPVGRGRPRIPLEIDVSRTCVGGLAVGAGAVEAISLNLRGHPLTAVNRLAVTRPAALARAVSSLLDGLLRAEPVAIGVSVTGLVDPDEMRILFSSAAPGHQVRLGPALRRAGDTPVVLNTEEHALSARWLMDHAEAAAEDVLVVTLEDGAVGASLLVHGHPNRGCVLGGNELGHMRLGVATPRCYCGGIGCVERVFSAAFLRAAGGTGPLADALAAGRPSPAARRILALTAQALANATIFIRPQRLVIAGSPAANTGFQRHLEQAWRAQLPEVFRSRVRIEWWPIHATVSAETAAWLAIARVMQGASRRVFDGPTRRD